jgi:hypothetical protein
MVINDDCLDRSASSGLVRLPRIAFAIGIVAEQTRERGRDARMRTN